MVKTGQALTFQFPSVGSTGALTNADSTPTCTMYVDGVADGGAVTVTNPATGRYKAACTVPTLTAGQCFEVWAAFAVATVNGGGIVFRDMADTTYPSETYARIGAPAGASIAADLAAIEAQTDDIGTAGAGLTAIPDSAGVGTLLTRLSAARAGYLDNLSTGPVATAAKLLSYFQSALRKDVTVDTDIGGAYDDATDSQEAIRDRGDAAWGSSGGISASDVWTYATRTLTQGAASVTAAVTGSSVTVYRGTRWSITLTGLTDFTGYTAIWLGVKHNANEDADTASICLVKTTTGLVAFDGDDTITPAHAAIAVNSSTSITVTVEAAATQYATPGSYSYAVKALNASGQPFMVSSGGTFNIVADIPMAVS